MDGEVVWAAVVAVGCPVGFLVDLVALVARDPLRGNLPSLSL